MRLNDLGIKYNTDKCDKSVCINGLKGKNYCNTYEIITKEYRKTYSNILELGVASGASLRMWADWFPNAKIHGFDIAKKPRIFDNKRIKAYCIDGTSLKAQNLAKTISPDMIIDDASHTVSSHKKSFDLLWPYLKSKGFYVIEDLHTCYWPKYGGSSSHDSLIPRACDWGAELSKLVNFQQYSKKEKAIVLQKFPYAPQIEFVLSALSILIIKKK